MKERVLLSEGGAKGLRARLLWRVVERDGDDASGDDVVAVGGVNGAGGARPLPLPKMRPPPSLRPDMLGVD